MTLARESVPAGPLTLHGQVAGVLVGLQPLLATLKEKEDSPDARYMLTTLQPTVRVTFDGFDGDRHAGPTRLADGRTPQYTRGTVIRNSRQVSLVSVEELDELAAALGIPRVLPEWLGANLALGGIPRFSQLPPSTRLYFPQDAVLVVSWENHPCVYPGKLLRHFNPGIPGIAKAFVKVAHHRRGLVSWVERPGSISMGDTVRVEVPPQELYHP
jgi:hypothetical protein